MITSRKATHRLLDSVWTVEFKVEGSRAEIIKYNRTDKDGYDNESKLMQHTIVENDKREAIEILLKPYTPFNGWVNDENCTERYTISNPKYIFDYE